MSAPQARVRGVLARDGWRVSDGNADGQRRLVTGRPTVPLSTASTPVRR